jgi:carbonic anhydrase
MNRILVLGLALSLSGCFTPRLRHSRAMKAPDAAEQASVAPASEAAPIVETAAAPTPAPILEKKTLAEIEVPIEIVPSAGNTNLNIHSIPDGVEPTKALQWLKNGNRRFLKSWNRKDGKTKADIENLATGQHPHTIVLSCSDSRVPPEHVFDQALGEIFTVRVAGEALDSSVIASVEYAALHLGTRLILVMGHTQCGAVGATIEARGRDPAGSPSLDRLVADIGPRVDYATPDNKTKDLYKESFDNAKGVAADLVTRSDIIRSLVAKGRLKIATAIYTLKTGAVDFE